MRDLVPLAIHLLVSPAKLVRPGGVCAVIAESLLLKHQLLITARSRRRGPNLTATDRFVIGLLSLLVIPLIGTIRREYLDRVFLWNAADLVRKLREFAVYYNTFCSDAGRVQSATSRRPVSVSFLSLPPPA